MDTNQHINLIKKILSEIRRPDGSAAIDKFISLRNVDAKVREVRVILHSMDSLPVSILEEMDRDPDFSVNSRRVRLEALAYYCINVIRLIESGVTTQKYKIEQPPEVARLTMVMPNLEDVIKSRWIEAQKCQRNECFLSSIILMGSILEALLMARCSKDLLLANLTNSAPKDRKSGKTKPLQEWNLSSLIDVAVELGWLKIDRGKFGHALRESRNVVHPYVEITIHADFDEATCKTSWEVLKASVSDLNKSI